MRTTALIAIVLCGCEERVLEIRGEHRTFVVSYHEVPATSAEAGYWGLDLNGDGSKDNQAGNVLSTLARSNFVQSQTRTDWAIDFGELIQLVDVQWPDADDDSAAAGFALHRGRDPQPAPCESDQDTTCRRHLDGLGSFAIEAVSAFPQLTCIPSGEGFHCAGGRLPLLLGVFRTPIELDLVGARVVFADEGGGLLRGRIAGGITRDDLVDKLLATFLTLIAADVAHDCTTLDPASNCGCRADSAGRTYIGLFDTHPYDCTITLDEVAKNSLIVSLLAPDVTIDGQMLLSIGIGFEAMPATIR